MLFASAISACAIVTGVQNSIMIQNVLAQEEDSDGPTAVGCKALRGATCYIFDGGGNFIDKDRNRYPK